MLVFVQPTKPEENPDAYARKPQASPAPGAPGPQDRGLDQHREPRCTYRLHGSRRDDRNHVDRDAGPDIGDRDFRNDADDFHIDDEPFDNGHRSRGNRIDTEQHLDPCQLNAASAQWAVTPT
jgi:hypothetical protein